MWNDELALLLANNSQIPNNFSSQFNNPLEANPFSMLDSLAKFDPNTMFNTQAASSGWFDHFLPWKDETGASGMGWGMPLFNMGKSLFDGWLGLEKLDLAKDSLNFQKDAFSKQFENQRTLTNSELRDRQAARIASNPTAYQSVDEYMKVNGV